MASVASTDRSAGSGGASPGQGEYLVPDWVRVREENFGLLFYDVRSTRLTFVRSGDSLSAPPFTSPRRVLGVRSAGGQRQAALVRLLERLAAKGLIVDSRPNTD